MTTVAIAPTPILQFLNNQGQPCVGGTVLTQVGGFNYPTYQDAAGTIPLPNPIPLNSRGEISNAAGQSCELFLDTTAIYSFTLFDAAGNQLNQASSVSASVPATTFAAFVTSLASSIGTSLIGFIQAGAGAVARILQAKLREMQAVTPQDYGALGGGTNDDTAGFVAALATGKDVFIPPGITYKVTSGLTVNTANQRLFSTGWNTQINFVLASPAAAITITNASGWQQISNIFLFGQSNCTSMVSVGSAEVRFRDVWMQNNTSGGVCIYQQDEANPIFNFGMRVEDCKLHGSFTTGSKGIRFGLNSQTAMVVNTVIENFETGASVERNTDTLTFDNVTFETLMSTGYGIDMRSVASSSTYKAVQVRGCHFEDVYGGIIWGTTGGSGATYTDHEYHSNTFNGHSGGTSYFLTINGTCGAGCQNNRVEYNDATDASGNSQCTSFFNLNDANGAASLVSKKGNTVVAGSTAWVTGSQAIYAYTIRPFNGFMARGIVSGALGGSSSNTRLETPTVVYDVAMPWYSGEYLESVQWIFLPTGSTPQVTGVVTSGTGDVTATVATSGVQTGTNGVKKLITIPVNTVAVNGFNYWMEFTHTLNGGTTAYDYVPQLYMRL